VWIVSFRISLEERFEVDWHITLEHVRRTCRVKMATANEVTAANKVVAFVEEGNASCTKLGELFKELDIELAQTKAPSGSQLRESVDKLTGSSSLPAVFVNGTYIGGLNDGPEDWHGVTRLLATGKLHKLIFGSAPIPDSFDFDLVVIGGGSGGLACAREAATDTDKKVAVFDFVKPSPQGTTWDIGGTCVNVGCIPKKLMHTAAIHGEAHHDAKSFGWSAPGQSLKWTTLVDSVQKHIKSLNTGAKTSLKSKNVTYFNALGSFVNAHTVRARYADGSTQDITARNVVVAVGGRPTPLPNCEGAEHAIDSDDLFSLKRDPGKTLCIGASYVALECAGFLTGIGYDTTVMVRSILLRGFDQDCANRIRAMMQVTGTKFIRSATPKKIEKLPNGRFKVYWRNANTANNGELPPGSEGFDVFDTVFAAVGRKADTAGLNLGAAGLEVNRWGKFPGYGQAGERESTNIPHIYALGDCLEGVPELTPVAIQAGQFLARRLFKGSTRQMPYETVATAVFTPLEYGCVGVSEDSVREPIPGVKDQDKQYSASLKKTYQYSQLKPGYTVHSKKFTPLEWTVVPHRPRNACYVKVICHGEDLRLVGIHYCGPNAGEVLQGFSLAMRLGATYNDLRDTVGIHPTCAEIMTLVQSKPTAPKTTTSTSSSSGMKFDFSLESNPNGDAQPESNTSGPMTFDFSLENNPEGDVKTESDGDGTSGMTFDFDLESNPEGDVPAPKEETALGGMEFNFDLDANPNGDVKVAENAGNGDFDPFADSDDEGGVCET